VWIRQNVNSHAAVQPRVSFAPGTGRRVRRAFSLLEIMIAIGVLGIGLIMVAAIFPSALEIHRQSIEKSQALDLFNKAEAVLRSRINTSQLWVCPENNPASNLPSVPNGTDSPWYILPSANLAVGANSGNNGSINWDWMGPAQSAMMTNSAADPTGIFYNYANCLNYCYDVGSGGLGNSVRVSGLNPMDVLSDRKAPYTTSVNFSPFMDSEFEEAPNRVVWQGFYRRLANGTVRYAAAVTKINRGDEFAQQSTNTMDPATFNAVSPSNSPGFLPQVNTTVTRRLPAVWRVTVVYNANTRRLYNAASSEGLGELAPPGSKIMVGGFVWRTVMPTPPVTPLPIAPAGKVLTVVNAIDNTADGIDNPETIDVLEDTSDLPAFTAGNSPGTPGFAFDVLVIPPPITSANGGNGVFSSKPSNTIWKVNL